MAQTTWYSYMHSEIYADTMLRSVALSVARNRVGANRPIAEILSSEGITDDQYAKIAKNPMYKRYLENYVRELQDSGFSFAAKCKVLAEDLLPVAYAMARDPDVPPATRAKMVENLVDWADLKPKKDLQVAAAGSGFSISINFPDMTQPAVSNDSGEDDIEGDYEDDTPLLAYDEADNLEDTTIDVLDFDDLCQPEDVVPIEEAKKPEDPPLKVYAVKGDDSLRRKLDDLFGGDDDYAGEDFLV